jgi:hypothetical protein
VPNEGLYQRQEHWLDRQIIPVSIEGRAEDEYSPVANASLGECDAAVIKAREDSIRGCL